MGITGVPDLGRQHPIWGDSKWAEFFIYDVYTAHGRHQWAADVATAVDHNCDAFPRRDTHWFRDWWRPLRTDTDGGPRVMVRFFRLLAQHFPRGADTRYVRELTWGEYLHITSGAAGADVTDLAQRASGWPRRLIR